MEGFGHTHLDTLGIATTQIALGSLAKSIIYVHVSERAGYDAHAATEAVFFVDQNGACFRITCDRIGGTHFQTERGFTL
jgi:hypothetical protein